MDRGAWWTSVHGVTKSLTQLSDFHTFTHTENTLADGRQRLWQGQGDVIGVLLFIVLCS